MRLRLALASVALVACSGKPGPRAPSEPPARAFRIERPADLLLGAIAVGRAGDYRLDNGVVAVVVNAPDNVLGFAVSGGNLVDAARLGPDGVGRDDLRQMFLYLDDDFPRQGRFDRVEIAAAAGDEAVLVAHGADSHAPAIAIRHEYRLARGADYVTLRTTFTNTGDAPVTAYEVGDVFQLGPGERFFPGRGFAKGRVEAPWLASVGDHQTYGYTTASGELGGPHGTSWSDTIVATLALPPGASATIERFLVIGDGTGVAGVAGRIAALRGEPRAPLVARVGEATGAPIRGALVTAVDEDGAPAATGITDAEGRVAIPVPPGNYHVTATARGRAPSPTLTIEDVGLRDESRTVQLVMQPPGRVAVRVREGAGPVPAKLTVLAVGDTAVPALGQRHRGNGADNAAVTATGEHTFELAPGRYLIVASRGLEYTIASAEVAVEAGAMARLDLQLERVVDTAGYVGGDFHQHALPSGDSAVTLEDRVASNLAEGVEILVSTDHNALTDYAPVVARMAAPAPLFTMVGVEATSETHGHFNGYPVVPTVDAPRHGAPLVERLDSVAIMRALRALGDDVVVQVNHPRAPTSGYFALAGLDPAAVAQPPAFAVEFDAFELVNGKRLDAVDALLVDWYWLLSQGHVVTAMGNSDTHAVTDSEAGYPRSYVGVGVDDPRELTDAAVREAIKRRDVLITNGPYVTLRDAEGASVIGRTVKDGRVELVVQAAPWVDVTEIEIVASGKTWRRIPVKAEPGAVVRHRETLRLRPGGWYVVIVRGVSDLGPVVPETSPLAIVNPVWVTR